MIPRAVALLSLVFTAIGLVIGSATVGVNNDVLCSGLVFLVLALCMAGASEA